MRCQWVARLLYVQKTLLTLCFGVWKYTLNYSWEMWLRGTTRANESGGRGSIAGGGATFCLVFFSIVRLLHLNSIKS
jgi:hypothetical protein